MEPSERRAKFLRAALDSVPKPHHHIHPANVGHSAGLTVLEIEAEVESLVTEKWIERVLPPDGRVRLIDDGNGNGIDYATRYVRQHEERQSNRIPRRDWKLLIISNAVTFVLALLTAYLIWKLKWQ
jgi:hypothetical protein